jgi:hypothetical protein
MAGFREAISRLDREIPKDPPDWQAGTYMVYLLQYRVIEILGHWPTAKELHGVLSASTPSSGGLSEKM